jgi:hypothetical protein
VTKIFQGKNGGVPFPRTEGEWIENQMSKGHSFEDASRFAAKKMRDDVFGDGHKTDPKGNPIEVGKGSALQPTAQHHQALMISEEAKAKRAMTMGWHPGLVNAFDPSAAPAVRRRGPARKKPGRKPGPAAPVAAEA